MRLASQFLQYIQKPNLLSKSFDCLLAQKRCKHKSSKKLEEVSKKKSECMEPCKIPRKSIWSIFGSNKKQPKCLEKEKKPIKECETVEFVTEDQAEIDMKNVSDMGGKAYRTCGTAYILQKDYYEQPEAPTTNSEDQILEDMMKDPSLKGQCDPMPPFQSVELKLIALNERKLHPLYKKLMSIPKKDKSQSRTSPTASYKTRSGPILPEDFPAHLKINREMFEKKNILYEYKRTEPPQQLLARIVEMRNNERPQLGGKSQNKQQQDQDCSKK